MPFQPKSNLKIYQTFTDEAFFISKLLILIFKFLLALPVKQEIYINNNQMNKISIKTLGYIQSETFWLDCRDRYQ